MTPPPPTPNPTPKAESGAETLRDFQRETRLWADATFPHSNDHARLTHLRKEVDELILAPGDAEEMADVLLILSHHADRYGVDLLAAARAKFEKCKLRKWSAPDADGVCSHLAEGFDIAPGRMDDDLDPRRGF